jgi:ribosomal-protein-alanine N-acetyltransferase
MTLKVDLRLARIRDAGHLAAMSRDFVECGLGWSWTPARIGQKIRCPNNIVVVAEAHREILGFAIMYVGFEEARLNLLAVSPSSRNCGVGRQLVRWLERSALVAGVSVVYLEVRSRYRGARTFYERLGYRTVERVPGYYYRRETALRMARDLWDLTSQNSTT